MPQSKAKNFGVSYVARKQFVHKLMVSGSVTVAPETLSTSAQTDDFH